MRSQITEKELAVLSAWWTTGTVKGAARKVGVSEQTAKNQLYSARIRTGADTNADLVKMHWKLVASEAQVPLRKARYQVDDQYRAKLQKVAREAMRRQRAIHAGRTAELYAELRAAQGGCCAICGAEESTVVAKSGKPRRLALDHDHASSRIRGLLCLQCNVMLGNALDDPERLRAAIRYLESHAQSVSHNDNGEAA